MTGTFSSFNTALTALQATRTVMDVASNNVANAATPGYTRRTANLTAMGSPSQPALWSRYDGVGGGVQVSSVGRMDDALLDVQGREQHSKQSYLDTQQTVLQRVETGIGEPGPNGVAAALSNFRSSLQDLANNPGQDASRSQLLSTANSVADAIRLQAANIDNEASDDRASLQAVVTQVNTVASSLAAVNKSIVNAKLAGTDANDLLDQRDQLAEKLAEATGAKTSIDANGAAQVSINGVSLVSGNTAATFSIATGVTANGGADGSPVTFAITDSSGTATTVPSGMLGTAGATADLLNTTLPNYRAGLDSVAKTFADQMNAQHEAGYDASGNPGKPLFTYDTANISGSLNVAITDPSLVAASSQDGGVVQGSNADAMYDLNDAAPAYQRLVNSYGSQVDSAQQLAANQQALTTQVDNAREQLGGVNTDEETVNLMAAQRGYQAASRVITTLDSMLDTLINHTGLVG